MLSETSRLHVAMLQFIFPDKRDDIYVYFFANTSLCLTVMGIKKCFPAKEYSWLWTGSWDVVTMTSRSLFPRGERSSHVLMLSSQVA